MRIWWLLALAFLACERPFVETIEPTLWVVEPDLTEVQISSVITIRVESKHFRALEGVYLNGIAMDPVPLDPAHWQTSVALRLGLNTFFLDATDKEGVSRRDTAYAVHLPHRVSLNAPPLPEGRGGHSIVRLRDGSIMVTGGACQRGGLAQGESFLLSVNSGIFGQIPERMFIARTGHTASILPDHRVLIVGGSRIDSPTTVNDLIETVEIFDPNDTELGFREIPVRGQPIRRVNHTSVIYQMNGELLLDLIGGYGDTRYGANPFFGIRQDLRTFRIHSNELVALNTAASAPFIFEPVADHTVTQADPNTYFILGSQFVNGNAINGNIRIHYPRGSRQDFSQLPELITPRTAHSTAPILNGLFVLVGGRIESSQMTTQMEIFHEQTSQFFSLRPSQPMVERSDHAAISTDLRTVLLVGGFNQDGTGIASSEYLVVSSE